MIKKALYAGSFDPITKGHLDIIVRAKKITDELIIAVLYNANKTNYWFSVDQRIEQIKMSLKDIDFDMKNVKILSYDGLLVDLVEKENVDVVIRGLRAVSDYEYEVQLNLTNCLLTKKPFETIFLQAARKYLYLSSSMVKEIALNKGELSYFVSDSIKKILEEKVKKLNGKG